MKIKQPEQFIGKTGEIARILFHKVTRLRDGQLPVHDRRWLFLGPPGVGKTMLAESLALALAGREIGVEMVNGQSVNIDLVRNWRDAGHYKPMFGDITVKLVDEVDGASLAACNELRSYLDRLPGHVVFIATTNKLLKELQPQLQSRFQQWRFEPVPADLIRQHLIRTLGLPEAAAQEVADSCDGNVRAAEEDATSYLDCLAAHHAAQNHAVASFV